MVTTPQPATSLAAPSLRSPRDHVAIIGGAGFIGSNLADALLADGEQVLVLDNLARPGVERNLAWLQDRHAGVHPVLADLRDANAVREAVTSAKAVYHLAAQVAVTSSLVDPRHDFAVNAEGTLNVLEALREHSPSTPLVFASTNKVYGQLADLAMQEVGRQHLPSDEILREHGIAEGRRLDFCTPYGCSKGVADQYVLDYAHSFGLRTAVLRMSCIYGPRQFGTEDQGWVAHFLLRTLAGEPITLYGDGMQVRDVLHVSDAVSAYRALMRTIDDHRGSVFNLGGGPSNAVSLVDVLDEIARLTGRRSALQREAWRTGDQPWFVADTRALSAATGWQARVGWRDGLRDLADWLQGQATDPSVAQFAIA